jgi:hypothetical protein
MDLLVDGHGSGMVHVLMNEGDGTFQPTEGYQPGTAPGDMFVTDLDGDSQSELLICGSRQMRVLPIKDGN